MRNRRTIFGLAIVLALVAAGPTDLRGQGQAPTYRVILYLAEEGAPQQVQIQRLDEVWSEADGAQRLQSLLDSGAVAPQVVKKIAFKRNSSVIERSSNKALDDLAALLVANPNVVCTIVAHTDNKKSADESKTITQGQADAARAYLIDKGVPELQVVAIGRGSEEPIADNNQSSGRDKNRRTELSFSTK